MRVRGGEGSSKLIQVIIQVIWTIATIVSHWDAIKQFATQIPVPPVHDWLPQAANPWLVCITAFLTVSFLAVVIGIKD
jgi:NADH:ubiquinone oxidoreductase subunit 4 (subunit M)